MDKNNLPLLKISIDFEKAPFPKELIQKLQMGLHLKEFRHEDKSLLVLQKLFSKIVTYFLEQCYF